MNDNITNCPLSWPVGWERVNQNQRKNSQFGMHTVAASARELEDNIRLMRGTDMIISSNKQVKANGIPYANQRTPDDPGVAVYFQWKKKPIVFACDKYRTVEDNLWAIVKHIEALRGQERWGVGSLDQAFAGYAALPDPNQKTWWEDLNVSQFATDEEIKIAHRNLSRQYHPDTGPGSDPIMFDRIQKAFKLAIGRTKS